MNASALDPRAHREIHQSAIALQALSNRLEEGGLEGIDTETAESIPAIINAASTSLATARSVDLQSPLVEYLEAELFRVSQLLRRVQRPSHRARITLLFRTVPRLLWRTAPTQIVAMLLLLCGIAIGYRTASSDALLALSFFPEAAGVFSIGDELLPISDATFANLWLETTHPDLLSSLMSLDGQLTIFLSAFAAAALLSIWIGGVLTPLLTLSMGGAMGALLGIVPSEQMGTAALRLFPILSMSSLAMILSLAGGVHVIRAMIPARDGRRHRHRARELQSALLCAFLGTLHAVVGVLLMALAVGPREFGFGASLVAMGWIAAYILYVGGVGSGLMTHLFPTVEAYLQRAQTDDLPYVVPPPSVHSQTLILPLREGSSTRVSLAGLSDRLAAYVVDSFVVLSGGAVIFWIAVLLNDEPPATAVVMLIAFLATAAFTYFFWTDWRWQGQTLGKRVFEIQTVRLDGERLDGWTMWLRSVALGAETLLPALLAALSYFATTRYVGIFVFIAFGATFYAILFPILNPYRQRLADLITGTVTINVPDPTQGLLPPVASSEDSPTVALEGMPLDARRHLILASFVDQARRGQLEGARHVISALAPHWNAHTMSDAELVESLEKLYAVTAPAHTRHRFSAR